MNSPFFRSTLCILILCLAGIAQAQLSQSPVINDEFKSVGIVGKWYGLSYIYAFSNISLECSLEGNLPPGFEFEVEYDEVDDSKLCYIWIEGTPAQTGTFNFSVRATNAAGSRTKTFTIVINADNSPVIPPQIAGSGNLITQARNSINLAAKTNATIEVYNLSGKLISRQSYLAGNHSISFGHLPKGMYVVKASFGKEKQVLRMQVR